MKKTAVACLIIFAFQANAEIDTTPFPYYEKPALTSATFRSTSEEKNYAIHLNPHVLQEIEQKIRSGLISRPNDAGTEETQPSVALVVDSLVRDFGIKIDGHTSWAAVTIFARMNQHTAQQVLKRNEISSLTEESNTPPLFSQTTGDNFEGSEIISWSKSFTNTNDNITTTNNFYLLDSPIDLGTFSQELNIIQHENIDPPNPSLAGQYHGTHVAGVIGARRNDTLTRGINPGQPIKYFGSVESVIRSFDRALRVAELSNDFAVANLSRNIYGDEFAANRAYGVAMRAASNRLFITQAAGNGWGGIPNVSPIVNGCPYAYNYQGAKGILDGIMVVGGLARSGSRWSGGESEVEFINGLGVSQQVMGSISGPCIEAWAPAQEITSLARNGGTRVSSGTSYSAPMVSAIASRYGDNKTRPIEREQYIYNSLQFIGYDDVGTTPLQRVAYTPPSSHNIPKRLPIIAATSPTNPNGVNYVFDTLFYDINSYWNAGQSSGTVIVDLGTPRSVTGVRLTTRTHLTPVIGSPKPIDFAIYGGPSAAGATTNIALDSERDQSDLAPTYIPVVPNTSRFIRIDGNNIYSWLSFAEIEVYGF